MLISILPPLITPTVFVFLHNVCQCLFLLWLQGVFKPLEKLADVRMFIADALVNSHSIFSIASVGKILQDDTANLVQLDLVGSMHLLHVCF